MKAGDGCYRCSLQWQEPHEAGAAPTIKVSASHERAAVHPQGRIADISHRLTFGGATAR
ncbi:hypothetical protein E1180_20055 [Roseibium denhamense]|nr:hypothetical protein [Roseibium denhamense]